MKEMVEGSHALGFILTQMAVSPGDISRNLRIPRVGGSPTSHILPGNPSTRCLPPAYKLLRLHHIHTSSRPDHHQIATTPLTPPEQVKNSCSTSAVQASRTSALQVYKAYNLPSFLKYTGYIRSEYWTGKMTGLKTIVVFLVLSLAVTQAAVFSIGKSSCFSLS